MDQHLDLPTLINDAIDLATIEADHATLTLSKFDLNPMLEKMAIAIAPSIAAEGLAFSLDIHGGLERQALLGNRFRLKQIPLNLVGNAVKFTAHGSVTVRARPVVESQGGY